MNNRTFIYNYEGKDYTVNVSAHAFQKATYFRYRNGEFYVSTNRLTPNKMIVDGLNKYAKKLIKDHERRNSSAYSFNEKWLYLFGEKINMPEDVLENNIDVFLKKQLLNYLDESVRNFERKMNVEKPYAIHVRKMKTRFGSNSLQTHSLSFQLDLVHFSKEIIDSVIIHELAHHFYRDHSFKFYNVIYKECPNYWDLKRKLRRRIYK